MKDGLPVVDFEKCTACGVCVSACPKKLMQLVPDKKKVSVSCSSNWSGKEVKSVCSVGCIGCGICVKNCPASAIVLENNLARIVYEKCINCGICVSKCPTKAILDRTSGIALAEPSDPAKVEKMLAKIAEKKAWLKLLKKKPNRTKPRRSNPLSFFVFNFIK
jgi:formate hydrogenlyase subunit 6/NADH:ubiquinone oxidoreductase subunit I